MKWGGGWGGPWGLPLSITFTAPSGIIPTYDPDLPYGLLEAYTNAVGRQVQRMIGVPMTRVRIDLGPTDTLLFVETTLGFSESGELWIGNQRYSYTGKTASAFVDVQPVNGLPRTQTIGIKTSVTPHEPSVAPQ